MSSTPQIVQPNVLKFQIDELHIVVIIIAPKGCKTKMGSDSNRSFRESEEILQDILSGLR